jgi:DNA-binding transcriptional ArsR family regulator
MAFSKSHKYSQEDHAIAEFAKAIGHATRPTILRNLARKSPTKALSILKNHPISQPAVSQHLEILRKANLVKCSEQFPYTYYELNWETIQIMKKMLKKFLKDLK